MNSQTGLQARIHDYEESTTPTQRAADSNEDHTSLSPVEASAEAEVSPQIETDAPFFPSSSSIEASLSRSENGEGIPTEEEVQGIQENVESMVEHMKKVERAELKRSESALKAEEMVKRRWRSNGE